MNPDYDFVADLDLVLRRLRDLLIAKNAAYGDSALNPVRIFARGMPADAGIRVRLDDKLSRIANGREDLVTDEEESPIFDTLGYLTLLSIHQLRAREGEWSGYLPPPPLPAPPPEWR